MTQRVRVVLVAGIAVAAAIFVFQAGSLAQAPPPPPPPPPPPGLFAQNPAPVAEVTKGTGLLLGQVLDASTKAPIAGAVVVLSGTPLVVTASSPSPLSAQTATISRSVLVDRSGRFVFHSLPAGRYTLSASAPLYVYGSFGARRPNGAGQAIELTRDDEKRDGLILRMWKAANISGTIVDEHGEPVVGVGVRTAQRLISGGRQRWSTMQTATTDDRGMYRLTDLPPGEFLVAVLSGTTSMPASVADTFVQEMMSGISSMSAGSVSRELSASGVSISMAFSGSYRIGDQVMQSSVGGRGGISGGLLLPPPEPNQRMMVYASQYFPSASTVAQASIITLASGEDRPGVDLRLRLVPSLRVSGRVMGPDGPAANLGIKLFPVSTDEFTTESGLETATTATDASGSFTFLGVTPGQYTLKALRVPRALPRAPMPSSMIEITGPNGMMMGYGGGPVGPAPPPPLPPESTLWVTQSLTVADTDVAGVALTLRAGTRIGGRIVFEGGEAPAPIDVQQAFVQLSPIGVTAATQLLSAPRYVSPEGQFSTVGYPPGRYNISATLPTRTPGDSWRFKGAMLGGRDVSDGGFEVAGEDITSLTLVFTKAPASEINGTVRNGKAEPDASASVVIIPSDNDLWRKGIINTRRVRSARVGTTGSFRFFDVPPGSYFIAAIPEDQLENYQQQRVLEMIAKVATIVTISEGAKIGQSLTTQSIR